MIEVAFGVYVFVTFFLGMSAMATENKYNALVAKTKAKEEKVEEKKNFQDLSSFTFGVALLQNGSRSPVEHMVINKLHEKGAQCTLAGRTSVRAMVLDKDVIDGMGVSNPQFVIVGTIEEKEIFLDDSQRPTRAKPFFEWWDAKFPLALSNWGSRNNADLYSELFKYYELRHEDVYALYTKETGQSPYINDSFRKYKLRVSIDCYSAWGTVVGSLFCDQEFLERDRIVTYRLLSSDLVSCLHISHHVDSPSNVSYPNFAQDQVDGILSRYGYVGEVASANPTRQLSEDEFPVHLGAHSVDVLIAADQPMKTRVLKTE